MGKRKSKRGRAVKRNLQVNSDEPEELKKAPHSFVMHRGAVSQDVLDLVKDFRKVMEPFTASSLKVRRQNTIKDFVSVAGPLHVSHMCIFTQTEIGAYLRICRLPRGPTLTFKIHNFSLTRDVVSALKKSFVSLNQFAHSALLVLNSFSGEGLQMKLMAQMFQNMFPTLNLTKVNLNNVKRCVLLNYNPESGFIDFRHYAIKVVPVGLSRGVKKIVQSKVPDLSRYQDISEYLTNPGYLSESEFEDDPASHVTAPQKLHARGIVPGLQSSVRTRELGPRLTLQLMKVEEGLLDGEVLYHLLVHKTEEEKLMILKKREETRKLKEKRRKAQEENKRKKEKQKEELKEKSLEGMRKKFGHLPAHNEKLADDDDAAYYEEEVGETPDPDLFLKSSQSGVKRKMAYKQKFNKKFKSEKALPKKKVTFSPEENVPKTPGNGSKFFRKKANFSSKHRTKT